MDLWILGNKAALLLYVIAVTHFVGRDEPVLILVDLLYVILNVGIPIFKSMRTRQIIALFSGLLVIYAAVKFNPMFFLLLPVNIYELAISVKVHRLLALGLSCIPLLMLNIADMPIYALTTLSSYLLLYGIVRYQERQDRLEAEHEVFRRDVARLTKTLNENHEYIRQSEYSIKLEERNHLSQRIHDEVGHSMAGALIQMEAARMLLDRDSAKAGELLGNAISISKEGLERIRLTLKELKPKQEELGIQRLRLFADEVAAQHGLTTTVTHNGDMDVLKPIHWKIIQENAREAVTNTLKYGHATSIAFEVSVFHRLIRFIAADNGGGAEKVVKGLGMIGMEERAASVGGKVLVDGQQGFRVTTLLPIGDNDAHKGT